MGQWNREIEHQTKTGVKWRYYVRNDGIFSFCDVFRVFGVGMRRRVVGRVSRERGRECRAVGSGSSSSSLVPASFPSPPLRIQS